MAQEHIEPDTTIDLSGLKCPLPVLRTKKALSRMEPGEVLMVLTTDPSSVQDIPAFARLSRHELVSDAPTRDGHMFLIRR